MSHWLVIEINIHVLSHWLWLVHEINVYLIGLVLALIRSCLNYKYNRSSGYSVLVLESVVQVRVIPSFLYHVQSVIGPQG